MAPQPLKILVFATCIFIFVSPLISLPYFCICIFVPASLTTKVCSKTPQNSPKFPWPLLPGTITYLSTDQAYFTALCSTSLKGFSSSCGTALWPGSVNGFSSSPAGVFVLPAAEGVYAGGCCSICASGLRWYCSSILRLSVVDCL